MAVSEQKHHTQQLTLTQCIHCNIGIRTQREKTFNSHSPKKLGSKLSSRLCRS